MVSPPDPGRSQSHILVLSLQVYWVLQLSSYVIWRRIT